VFILETCTVALWCLIKAVGAVMIILPFGLGPLLLWLFWLWVTGPVERRK